MRKSVVLIGLACALPLLGAASAPTSDKDLLSRLDGPFQPPAWLADTKVPFSDKELTDTNKFGLTIWAGLNKLQGDPANFRGCLAALHRALELNSDPKLQADCIQSLAIFYEMMFQDHLRACQMYRRLGGLAEKVPEIHDPQNHLSRGTERMAVLGMARNAALLGLKDRARQLLKGQQLEDWRELMDLAVIDRLLGDAGGSVAAVEQAVAAGAKGNAFAQVSSCGRGVILLYLNGADEQVRKHLPKYTALRDAYVAKQGPLTGNLAGQDERIRLIAANGGKQPAMELKELLDGVYTAQAQGMHGPVELTATVKEGKLADLKVKADEKRAFGAVVEVPRRIVEGRKLPVDAVSGATVTSLTIEHAAAEALRKARKK